jgi:hypothetical protein
MLIAIVVGALLVALLLEGCSSAQGSTGSGAVLGKEIFDTGRGQTGSIPRSMMGGVYTTEGLPCAGCHGAQGQGTGIGPSITRATPRHEARDHAQALGE